MLSQVTGIFWYNIYFIITQQDINAKMYISTILIFVVILLNTELLSIYNFDNLFRLLEGKKKKKKKNVDSDMMDFNEETWRKLLCKD